MADYKVIVAGAGPAGLAAAALLAKEGVATALVAPAAAEDPRTVALMQPSIQLLRYLDIWPGSLEAQTAPLRKLRIIDDTGSLLVAPNLEFDSEELNLEAFGWNIPLGLLLPALRKRAEDLGVTFIEATATGARSSGDAIHITLSNASEISASLCLAADGANSAMRKAAGIATDTWSYDQTAIATSFAHSMGHGNVSTEYHKSAGPFTTVPLPENRSSLVWMERPARAEALMAMSDKELAAEIQIETHGELGLDIKPWPAQIIPHERPHRPPVCQGPRDTDRRSRPCCAAHWRARPQHVAARCGPCRRSHSRKQGCRKRQPHG